MEKMYFMHGYQKDADTFVNFILARIDNLESYTDASNLRTFWTKKQIVFGSGTIIEIEMDLTTEQISYKKNAIPVARWPHKEEVAKWTALTRAAKAQKQIQALCKEDWLKEALEPVADAYAVATGSNRTAILAEAIRIITGGRNR